MRGGRKETGKIGLALYADGNRVFYVLGVLKYFIEKGLRFDAVATYSAGSAILPLLLARDFDRGVEVFARLLDGNKENVRLGNLLTGEDVFPHDGIYSRAVAEVLEEKTVFGFGKPLRVVVSEFSPGIFGARFAALGGFLALFLHEFTRRVSGLFFLKTFKFLFSIDAKVVDLRRCASREDLFAVILGSSTIYPFIRVRERGGRSMLDGIMSLGSPIGALSDCEHVLSIHPHRSSLRPRDGLVSVFPLAEVKLGALDYVGSADIKAAFAQGYAEGRAHHSRLEKTSFFTLGE